MRKLYTILFIAITFSSSAQTGSVIYEAIIKKDQPANNEMFSPYYEKAKENLTQIKFELQFNKHESLFFIKLKNGIDENKQIRFAKPFIAFMGTSYQDTINTFTQCDDLLEKTYLVKKSTNKKWEITNETKKINGYLCYKAILDETHHYNGNTFARSATAWFCPKIPYSFGPNGYGGLPGLILELQNYKCIYGIRKITYSPHAEKKIQKPKGEEITEEKFNIKLMEILED